MEGGELGEGDQKAQTFIYKIPECNVQYGGYS